MTARPAAPATPLPYRCDSHPERDFAEIVNALDGVVCHASHEDAHYIVESANSYPRLLAERAELIAWMRAICDGEEARERELEEAGLPPQDPPRGWSIRTTRLLLARLGEGRP